jgi:tripartite-type tricarboxylate transporter receptor subunit TctC
VYRSNFDALVNMAADDHSVNFVMDRLTNYKQFQEKNNKIQALGVNCVERVAEFPNIKTLKEQGLTVPYIWQYTVASKNMDPSRRQDIANIFNNSMLTVGKSTMFNLSDFISPVFYNESAENHWDKNLSTLRQFRKKYEQEIKAPN